VQANEYLGLLNVDKIKDAQRIQVGQFIGRIATERDAARWAIIPAVRQSAPMQ
jgi:hypothetical protein